MSQLQLFALEAGIRTVGDPDLTAILDDVIRRGFPEARLPAGADSVEIRWNARLRTTVGRAVVRPGRPLIELAPAYHRQYPDELVETVAHEFAHVLHPGAGHGTIWKTTFAESLERLAIPVRRDLTRARRAAPTAGRYVWRCANCDEPVAIRARRCREEVASYSLCCRAPIAVYDARTGRPAPRRPFTVACGRCATVYVAYEDGRDAEKFARTHRCRCGGRLTVRPT